MEKDNRKDFKFMDDMYEPFHLVLSAITSSSWVCDTVQLLKLFDQGLYEHSIRTAMLTANFILFGNYDKMGGVSLQSIIIGSLVHDCGFLGLSLSSRLKKTEDRNRMEKLIWDEHIMHGYEKVSRFTDDTVILDIINMHHERLDGSGYPQGLKGNEIPSYVRIVIMANALDNMFEQFVSDIYADTDVVEILRRKLRIEANTGGYDIGMISDFLSSYMDYLEKINPFESVFAGYREQIDNAIGKTHKLTVRPNLFAPYMLIINSIVSNLWVMTSLVLLNAYNKKYYKHAISVAMFAANLYIFGNKERFDGIDPHSIVLGALLHDIGYVATPNYYLMEHRIPEMTPVEKKMFEMHIKNGIEYIKEKSDDQIVIDIVSMHHELLDGTGLPNHLRRGQIPAYVSLVNLADVLDSILEHCFKEKMSEKEIYDLLVKEFVDDENDKYDLTFTRNFATTYNEYLNELDPFTDIIMHKNWDNP